MQRQRRNDAASNAGGQAVTDFGALEHCGPEKACSDNTTRHSKTNQLN
jgi:hypothetical protein